MFRLGVGLRSRLRLALDVWLLRFQLLVFGRVSHSPREVACRSNTRLRYRLNRGDLQGIREVWCCEVYRLPFDGPTDVLVDLGANIGLATLWLNRTHQFKRIVAVEPEPANAALVRQNLTINHVPAEVIEAAIGPRDGKASFIRHDSSNLGHVADGATAVANNTMEVPMVSMNRVLEVLASDAVIDVLKLDIEGGEGALLLEGSREWLRRVRAIVAELHPDKVDCDALINYLDTQGFDHIAANSVFPENMTAFVRRQWPATPQS